MTNPLDLVVVCQILFGLGFLVVGGVLYRANVQLRAYGARTTGTVVALRARGSVSMAASTVQAWAADVATIRFRTRDGDEVLASSEVRDEKARHRLGDRVRVLYDPADPQRMQIDTSVGRNVLTAVWLLTIGTVIEAIAVATALLAVAATG